MADIAGVLIHAPLWVWPLLAGLVWLGLRARREREIPVAGFYAMPFFAFMSMVGMASQPAGSWAIFAVCYGLGLWLGDRAQGGLIIAKSGGRVRVRGEAITLAALMTIFWLAFAGGYVAARAPEVAAALWWRLGVAALSGAVSGQFAGRALRVIRAPAV